MFREFCGRLAAIALAAGTGSIAHAQVINQEINQSGGTTHVHIYNFGAQGAPSPRAALGAGPMGGSYWDHNSSVMVLVADGARRRFYYHRPRPGMAEAGARSGSLLFDGMRRGNTYSGTATVFAGACGTFTYGVDGYVVADRRVVMRGLAPRVDRRTCGIVDYRPDELAFDLM
ncbi:hypothetical protein [Methylobacterium frigidaeris]|uniref:Uncharacterized protein n=1 Tax=Methylobacterium frigidaeris TaxID=2038277 RepID=A0AA37H7G3_9HYPH|nr:hypothetical protein [Methylobacterium frigidaeris]PIK74791.1 hypothetical protein CS379_00585 [Methylobacterium frigidaeris]GJD60493.1 hypothetical protein MPEAHAMD_0631 [Methylobacterium frigidaeris]